MFGDKCHLECLEWRNSLATDDVGEAFFETQGYVWNTQSDMLFATIKTIVGKIIFSGIQDKQLQKIEMGSHLNIKKASLYSYNNAF